MAICSFGASKLFRSTIGSKCPIPAAQLADSMVIGTPVRHRLL